MLVSKYRQVYYLSTTSNITLISDLVGLLMEKDLHYNLIWNAFDITRLALLEKWEASLLVNLAF